VGTQDISTCCCCNPVVTQLQYISTAVQSELIASVLYGEFRDGVGSTFVGAPSAHPVEFTFDSGSSHHILSFAAALLLFRDPKKSSLRVLGVSGQHTEADLEGHVVLSLEDPSTGEKYLVDLGMAHSMRECPVNLLSISLLIAQGSTVHFEDGNCWFQPRADSPRIPFRQHNGLFTLLAEDGSELFASQAPPVHAFSVHGVVYGAQGDIALWHKRMRHIPTDKLLRIYKHDLVQGFNISGRLTSACVCDSCRQANIRHAPIHSQLQYADPATYFGHTISTDLKEVPFLSFLGYRYVICFVDHFSRMGFCYFLRSKTEVTPKLRQFVNELARRDIQIRNLQSDRGSEYFSQEGTSKFEQGRNLHEFSRYCELQGINHVLYPIGNKAKLAERWFLEHFTAADVMLWEGRLSPAFWADAVSYSMHLYNLTPNDHLGGNVAPITVFTGDKPRWDKVRVFGSTVYEHIPNNMYAKVPGLPKGRKLIFVGFSDNKIGFRVFCPESRRYWTTTNLYFYESFSDRIDSLRHHDQRRALLKQGADQPVVIDDFADSNIDSVRNLYLNPDVLNMPVLSSFLPDRPHTAPHPASGGAARQVSTEASSTPSVPRRHVSPVEFAPSSDQAPVQVLSPSPTMRDVGGASASPSLGATHGRSAVEKATDESANAPGPFSRHAIAAERQRQDALRGVILRPVRLLAIGKEQKFTPEDKAFLDYAAKVNAPCIFKSPCPKRLTSDSGRRYLKYMHAKTVREAYELGATRDDFLWDYKRAWISFPKHEPIVSGHIFHALNLAEEHRHTHVLHDFGMLRHIPGEFEPVSLGRGYNARGSNSFNHVLATVYEPEVIAEQFAERERALRFAESQAAKVLNADQRELDERIAPEPTRYEETLADVCPEHLQWKQAMDEEIDSMVRFGVFYKVPRSAAGRRQVLGCKWVYKRKLNRLAEITRYRARLVAQGFRQRAYDSYDPDGTYSPVVHKNSLRLFLSVCAAMNLKVFQCDIKSAFLQADLHEPIYMQPPPGYTTHTASGEPEIWQLKRAIYGLKQASASFWDALSAHLLSKGFKSTVGDPCLLKRVLPNGEVVLCAVYVDDVVFGTSSQAAFDDFLAELRERFVIEEGEGKKIDFLLGMAIDQDLEKGTISINMEMMITKLCESILTKEELVRSRSIDTPMNVTPLPKLTERIVPKEQFDYLSVVGSLLHVTNCVRVDISLAVGILARHAATPGPAHVTAAKRVLMYLYNTRSLGITYSRSTEGRNFPIIFEGATHPLDNGLNRLQVFCDSDYAADISRRSLMGNVVMLNGGPISWTSVLGKTVCTSTAEAEVSAAVTAAKEAVHLKRMLIDLDFMDDSSPILIAEDNAACIAQAEAGLRHVRNAKHYEVRLRFLQQLVVDKEVEFRYCPTDRMIADFLTKPLDASKFVYFRDQIMVPPKR
jgi:hypothetical protein